MKWASEVYKALNGLIAVYKSPRVEIEQLAIKLQGKLSNEFNKMPYEPQRMQTQDVRSSTASNVPIVVTVPDIVNSSLVLGPRYKRGNFQLYACEPLSFFASGVQIFAIETGGRASSLGPDLDQSMLMRVYQLRGMFGRATTTGTPDGNTLIRTGWRHVTQMKLDRLLAGIESTYQAQLLAQAGVVPNTDTAYRLAASGSLVRPKPPPLLEEGQREPPPPPVIYGLRCVQFDPPFFTLELHAINENTEFLVGLVEDLGVQLKSSALVTQLRRLRHGRVKAESCLLLKDCTAAALMDSIDVCSRLHPASSLGYLRDQFLSLSPPEEPSSPPRHQIADD